MKSNNNSKSTQSTVIVQFSIEFMRAKCRYARNIADATANGPEGWTNKKEYECFSTILQELEQLNDETIVSWLENRGDKLEKIGARHYRSVSVEIRELLYRIYEKYGREI